MSQQQQPKKANNTLAQAKDQPKTLRAWIESDAFKHATGRALPKHLDPDRMLQIAVNALNKTPDLAKCSQASFLNGLLVLSASGLKPDGKEAALIPYKTECQVIVMVGGMVKLLWQSGQVGSINSDVIFAGDQYTIQKNACLDHVRWEFIPPADRPEDKGEPIAVWGEVEIKGGGSVTEVMAWDQVEAIKKRSRAKSGPWVTDELEMARKTVLRRIAKRCPLSDEAQEALDNDTDTPQFNERPTNVVTKSGGVSALEEKLAGGI